MTTSRRIVTIIPCLNESGRIHAVVCDIQEQLPECDVIVIDDASTDTSAQQAAQAGAGVLSHPCNQGYGAALETGYVYAMRNDYDILLQMDGDGQHCAKELRKLLAPILDDSADLVIGSRYSSDTETPASSPLRRLGHRLFGLMVLVITRQRFSDPTSGFQAMNRRTLRLFSSGVFPCDYPDSDVIVMAHLAGLRIREVPVRMLPRDGGVSMHSGLKPLYYAAKMLLSIFVVLLNYRQWQAWRQPNGALKT